MHLKTLTLRGFKSFASATTLDFEPGITCVVGPNGSGKSNVVDALAWVMGEQGAKSLRGGNMADVIFAGTASRPPLGRAEVSLTIDNSDGVLPIEYTEVTISRTLFRNGGSEYAINGTACRLLDIQELLSDTGMGREMHVIVGQGQLDSVLSATPEARRAFIEEAAGVLKHRRRKEKALRKLDSMSGNLARLNDLVGEIRRQLGPLARQAQVARKAQTVQTDLRDARARLLADDLVRMLATLESEQADEQALLKRRTEVHEAQNTARSLLAELETAAARAAPDVNEAAEVWFRLSSLRERLRGTATLAGERIRLLGTPEAQPTDGRDPDDLDEQAAKARAAEAELHQEQQQAADLLASVIESRRAAEAGAARAEESLTAVHRGLADRREGLAKLTGQVAAKRSRLEATEAELQRLRTAHSHASERAIKAEQQYAILEQQTVGAQAGEEDLKAAHQGALEVLDEQEIAVHTLVEAERQAATEASTWQARRDALDLALARQDATGALLDDPLPGILGALADEIQVTSGYENAIAAALGVWAEAAVAESIDRAADALRHSRDTEAGIASLVIADSQPPAKRRAKPAIGVWAADLITATDKLQRTLDRILDGIVVVDRLEEARRAASEGLVAVTFGGDIIAPTHARGGLGSGPSVLELSSARDEAHQRIDAAETARGQVRQALEPAQEALQRAQTDVTAALASLNDSNAELGAVSRQLAELGATARSSSSEAVRSEEAIQAAMDQRDLVTDELAELTDRLQAAHEAPDDGTDLVEATSARDEAVATAAQARSKETDARLSLRTVEERTRAITGRAQSLERAARAERQARTLAVQRAERRAQQAATAHIVAAGAQRALVAIEQSLTQGQQRRDELEAARTARDEQIGRTRAELDTLGKQHAQLTDVVHKDEVARAQQMAKVDQLQQRSIEDLGLDPDVLIEEYGPHVMVPVVVDDGVEEVEFVRVEQEKRLRQAERALTLLGKVNPLALEEHKALEERHKFLAEQLTDIKRSREDLLGIIKDINNRVEQVFADAFADTAREFEDIFPRLFPGGEGKLILTDPSDLLATGIEVEARPPGKKVKRLSLLSGGERALTAVAMLVAIFKARPSPFYVMDEVEAALDDVNLGRVIDIFAELSRDSQLIIITHQKRTMEIADALYGVTMRGDGVTTVISQRMNETAQ